MRWWRASSFVLPVAVVALGACGGGDDAGGERSGAETVRAPETGSKRGGEASPAPEGLKAISKILAPGRVHRGVTYPIFEEGLLKTVLTAEEMVRVNDEELDLVDLVIETYGKDRKPDYRIDLHSAKYFLGSEELTSDEESVVTGRTFTIRGDRMIYRSAGGVARMEGNIRMVIKNVKSLTTKVGDGNDEAGEAAGEATEKETQ